MGLHSRPDKRPDPSPTLCSEHNDLAVEVLRAVVNEVAEGWCVRDRLGALRVELVMVVVHRG